MPNAEHVEEIHLGQLEMIKKYGDLVLITPIILYKESFDTRATYILDG
jgi:hypothetical protein